MSTVDVESLRCFVLGAAHKKFRVAARRAALSPSAFSERIRRLEEEIGSPLFQRLPRGVDLTDVGASFLPEAKRCLSAIRRCAEFSAGVPQSPYEMVVGVAVEAGSEWIIPHLSALRALEPRRRLHVRFAGVVDVPRLLLEGSIDAVLAGPRSVHERSSRRLETVSTPLGERGYRFVASPQLLRHNPFATAEAAAHHTLIETHPDVPFCVARLHRAVPSASWLFSEVEHVDIFSAMKMRALDGAGVTVLPHSFVVEEIREGRLVEVLPEVEIPRERIDLSWLAEHDYAERLQRLAEQLQTLHAAAKTVSPGDPAACFERPATRRPPDVGWDASPRRMVR